MASSTMEAIVQELFPSSDGLIFQHPFVPVTPILNHKQNGTIFNHYSFKENPIFSNVSNVSIDVDKSTNNGDSHEEGDNPDNAMYKYMSQMLMEEDDLENKPCMFRDCMALQAAENYFSAVLDGKESDIASPHDVFTQFSYGHCSSEGNSSIDSHSVLNQLDQESSVSQPLKSLIGVDNGLNDTFSTSNQVPGLLGKDQFDLQYKGSEEEAANFFENDSVSRNHSLNSSSARKNHRQEDDDSADKQRSNKQLATFGDESESLEMYDNVLLCQNMEDSKVVSPSDECSPNGAKKPTRGRPRGGRKQGSKKKEMVDLSGLLTQCAQAMASYDSRRANELLIRVREHSTPYGDGTERLAHYLANALEARLSGMSSAFSSSRISAARILKSYKMYITACPFKKMSNILANKCIMKLSSEADRLHIIDFGILYGFQWPCLIQGLSLRPGGPPKLRITGIDFPQSGFRPAERVQDTGRRLEKYCKRFNVPFEFKAIAKKWDTITLEELDIERGEVLVVNSLYRLENLLDETVVVNSPRDAVLDLIRRINPDMFIHGVVNGTYNTPFFATRFREALFHFSSLFDMFEATLPREDEDRMLFEEEMFGRDAMNVIACEGTERVERPETYKQWQGRTIRAGFRQLPLEQDIVKLVRDKVRSEYHKDFSVDEHGHWMLQGWKGRVIHALCIWKPC